MLLSLLPPSCIVASMKEVANKQFSLFSAISHYSTMSQVPSNMEMDVVSNSIVWERSNLFSKASSRSPLVFSSTSSVFYYECIEVDNNKPEEDIRKPIDSSQLSYKNATNKGKSVSRVTNTFPTDRKQCESNMALALKTAPQPQGRVSDINSSNSSQQSTLNIQLPYNINQAMDQDSWDSDFHPISLHRLIEHLPSDIKNIKKSLNQMSKYILNKSVKRDKVNNFDDFEGVGKMAWDFISAIYNSDWDVLSVDNNISFRNKVASKFTLKISNINNSKNKDGKGNNKLATVSRLSLPISAKSSKKVKDIVKFFKKNEKSKENETLRKSYA